MWECGLHCLGFFVVVVFLVGRNEGDWAGKGRANVKRRRGTGRQKKYPFMIACNTDRDGLDLGICRFL